MLAAVDYFGHQVLAWRVDEDQDCFCPECQEALFVKDGPEKITHFSHFPSSNCGYGTGESWRHQALKMAAMEAFENFESVHFEQSVIPGRRADVVVPPLKVAIECQVSPMRVEEWTYRTEEYADAGYAVLWLWDWRRLCGEYIPKELLLCHRICYGQLTAYSIESEQWYSVHLDSRGESGYYLGKRRRRVFRKKLPETVSLLKASNEGLRIANLMRPWWTRKGVMT